MALRLQIISRHRQSLGDRAIKEFGRDGGTIGRSLESDWALPDGQRFLSSRHASIDYRSGSYYIVDTSTNGVYVNEAEQPVGRGNPQRLFSGDRIRLGEYEISVEIEEEDSTTQQLADGPHVDPVSRAQRVPPPDPTRADLLQAHEITGVGIEILVAEETKAEQLRQAAERSVANLRLEDDPPPAPARADKPAPARPERPIAMQAPTGAPAPSKAPPPVSAAARVPPKAATQPLPPEPTRPASTDTRPPVAAGAPSATRAAPQATAALDSFFRGAGLSTHKLDAQEAEQALHRLGQLMREMIVGLNENLHVRTEQKNVLRAPNTTIQPQNNNPLKFSASVDEALQSLLFRQSSEYLSGVEAVREAFLDIKQHQQCMLAALRAAIADYVGRLDPDELESKFSHGKRSGLMNAANKLKYWDLYKDLYQLVSQAPPGQLPQQFLEDLARAYELETNRSGKKAAAFA